MKIVILGAQGNLGVWLVKTFFKNKQNTIYAWDREDVDITNKTLILEKLLKVRPDIIINAAAYNAVDKCEEDEKEFKLARKLNIEVPKNLANIAQKINACLVQYSSDYVFSGENKDGYFENSRLNPINKYGYTKAEGEKEIARIAMKGLKWYIIRTSKLFGPKGLSELSKPSFFDIMLKLAKEKKEIEVVDEEKSCFTYTLDLAQATYDIIMGKIDYGTYHIVNSESATWYEACKVLFELTNIKTKVIPVSSDKFPRPAKRPNSSCLVNTKLPVLRSYKDALRDNYKLRIKN